jgi:hypothetical protein
MSHPLRMTGQSCCRTLQFNGSELLEESIQKHTLHPANPAVGVHCCG